MSPIALFGGDDNDDGLAAVFPSKPFGVWECIRRTFCQPVLEYSSCCCTCVSAARQKKSRGHRSVAIVFIRVSPRTVLEVSHPKLDAGAQLLRCKHSVRINKGIL